MSTCVFFFFNDTATTEIYTLSLHDALPICAAATDSRRAGHGRRLLGNRPLSQSRSARTEPQRGRGAGGVARAPAVVHPGHRLGEDRLRHAALDLRPGHGDPRNRPDTDSLLDRKSVV